MRIGLTFVACFAVGCQSAMRADTSRRPMPDAAEWAGVYATADGGDDASQLLSIRWITLPDEKTPRPIYHLFAKLGSSARVDTVGAARIDGDRLTFAIASATVDDEGDSHAIATIERYVLRRVKDRTVLIREDALIREDVSGSKPRDGSLQGMLVKVADDPTSIDKAVPDATTIGRDDDRPLTALGLTTRLRRCDRRGS